MKSHLAAFLTLLALTTTDADAQTPTQDEAAATLHKVINFYRSNVGYEGAYLWRYAADLSAQEGEETATRTSGWTQPPGTPFVGEAYLKAWRLSGDNACLEAAVEVAEALINGQLQSGGWGSSFDLAEDARSKYAYRVEGNKRGKRNLTTFDDNKSQSAVMLLMHVDEALQFRNERIHEAVEYALEHMLASQYPNGAWPQQYSEPPDALQFPVKKASYPKTWSRTYPKQNYISYYTLNDSNMSRIIDMLIEAHRIYGRDDCFAAAERTGDFFLLAQMPEPQPGWAQQYNRDMHPAWARKFEPASITGGESQSVMESLLTLYRFTARKKFIEALPKAIAYYRNSQLPDGKLARFYELQTNRPLYFTKDYKLTYSDADMPTHYAFKVGSKLDSLERKLKSLLQKDSAELKPEFRHTEPVKLKKTVIDRAANAIQQLDSRGAWVEQGTLRRHEGALDVIETRTFARNLEAIAAYVGATK